ncbi:hypothetical protein AMK26_09255 [Streptomyces sp. CB03234]|uniref:endonuclease domain-containing protein n=1 Tax=Streptomyces sp. (strain CB03234) TaxID=1703937 RepID=UPI00093FF768|nr:DUF559 domain-containing protein [Streptomyces sp. CB03234]OKK06229.1 hypothetical protein AMK26_09255 [Streptomyces sp. CB03234]
MKTHAKQDLTALAQGGVLLTARALEAGWSRRRLHRRLRADGWTRVREGAWAAPGRSVDWETEARAVQLLRPRLVCSHRTAARLHRIELLRSGPGPEPAEFTDPSADGSSWRGPARRVHRMTLTDADCTVRRGLRVTTPVRTVGDLMRRGPRDHALVCADSALAKRVVHGVRRPPLLGRADLHAELASARKGGVAAREWLALADPASGSPAETIARLRMHDAGLHPESQPQFWTPEGQRIQPDFLFREQGLVVEIEGYAYHGTREAHARDVHRMNALQACPGVRQVLRFTATDVLHRPDYVIATIRQALTRLG